MTYKKQLTYLLT